MSEEGKNDFNEYVHMDNPGRPANNHFNAPVGLDDPNLSQEDRDMRLAIALQQQENASAMNAADAKNRNAAKSDLFRTGRSGVNTRLASVRDRDQGLLRVPHSYNNESAYKSGSNYCPPGTEKFDDADLALAHELQSVEQSSVGAALHAEKVLKKEQEIDNSNALRNARSGKGAFHKTRK
uniref:Uncharacterized protein n=1 Tax=Proboscia inermis TaxID=420281 RepID=A0A7S0CCL2_9STRA|mmetsp:Transcript_23641/g.27216  ORF Transcript_23641/g.27216 Transcript_23641/m.27216 type:complete len:180 (-) Transcript_23641:446-985(-)|eukprot:CAMPEP_0171292624 /NCGR_PEP_ID=MMETSP0816-20121228/117_1 /TAXON_ID=420281 /ORGANISM="Proboscia inermis, Strain CCAP1064/1" /LENGTH=179 /DNA_ID=CAMNT_0011762387 /DNA_START=69 /DNA_END=608 /DNA_ORIENTATION=-